MRRALMAMVIAAGPAMAGPLETARWQARPVVIFAPDLSDPRFVAQRAAFAEREPAWRDRDMRIFSVAGQSYVSYGVGSLHNGFFAARELRARFGIGLDEFAATTSGRQRRRARSMRVTDVSPLSRSSSAICPPRCSRRCVQRETRDRR